MKLSAELAFRTIDIAHVLSMHLVVRHEFLWSGAFDPNGNKSSFFAANRNLACTGRKC